MIDAAQAEVRVRSHGIRRLRLVRSLPRYGLAIVAALGIAASARMLIAPPHVPAAAPPSREERDDHAAEAFAALFARRYLTWSAADPAASVSSLETFAGSGLEAAAGLVLPDRGSQRVEWVEVVQEREPEPGERVYTVAAETEPEGLLYLTVAVDRTPGGALELAGYPAFVGGPAAVPARRAPRARAVEDRALEAVVRRALANYLASTGSELAADLAPGVAVAMPALHLQLAGLQRLSWAPGSAVTAVVQARDRRGTRYTLSYEIDVLRTQGRWEISAIQTVPEGAE